MLVKELKNAIKDFSDDANIEVWSDHTNREFYIRKATQCPEYYFNAKPVVEIEIVECE